MVRCGRSAVLAIVIALQAWPAAAAAQSTPPSVGTLQRAPEAGNPQPPPTARSNLIGARDDVIVTRVPTVVDNVDQLAGHRVRLMNARVAQVHEPRVFAIRPDRRRPTVPVERDEVVVLIDSGHALVEEGVSVIVDGILRTDYGAWMSGDVAWLKELDREMLARVSGRPVVIATSVRTPDGVELLIRDP